MDGGPKVGCQYLQGPAASLLAVVTVAQAVPHVPKTHVYLYIKIIIYITYFILSI